MKRLSKTKTTSQITITETTAHRLCIHALTAGDYEEEMLCHFTGIHKLVLRLATFVLRMYRLRYYKLVWNQCRHDLNTTGTTPSSDMDE